ncbi:hypothetical protein ES703_71342 [subsurface metagenome]
MARTTEDGPATAGRLSYIDPMGCVNYTLIVFLLKRLPGAGGPIMYNVIVQDAAGGERQP